MKNKKIRGFTLIELIAVLTIISIIASIAIPNISKYIDKANKTKVIAAVSELNNFVVSISFESSNRDNLTITDVIKDYGDISKLNINLKEDASFEIGNISGNLILKEGLVDAVYN